MSKQSPPLEISWKARPAVLIAGQECPFPSYCCSIMSAWFSRQMEQQEIIWKAQQPTFNISLWRTKQTNIFLLFKIIFNGWHWWRVLRQFLRKLLPWSGQNQPILAPILKRPCQLCLSNAQRCHCENCKIIKFIVIIFIEMICSRVLLAAIKLASISLWDRKSQSSVTSYILYWYCANND